jgi:hypothetical protein
MPVAGTRLEFEGVLSPNRTITLRPTVLVADADQELRWLGRLLLPGLFDGEHSFRIEPIGPGLVRFVQTERFRGLLVPFLYPLIRGSTKQGFLAMNQALKNRSERPDIGP